MILRIMGIVSCAALLSACTLGASAPESETVQTLSATEAPTTMLTIIPPTATPANQPADDASPTQPAADAPQPPQGNAGGQPQAGECPVPANSEAYTVVSGDTLFNIAQRAETSVETLVQMNCLDDADVLNIGQVLQVPATSGGIAAPNNRQLLVTPIVETRDGVFIVQPNTRITITWADVPENSLVSFTANDFLSDGGVIPLAEIPGTGPGGATIDFQVPAEFNGSIEAGARLPGQGGETLQAETILLQTAGFDDGPCRFVPHALGEPGFVYAQPDTNSTQLGQIAFDARYTIGAVQVDVQQNTFYRIDYDGQQGWVSSNKGDLRGDCALFE